MTKKQDIDDALARLADEFPRTFVQEKYQPHWPLKVGIAADLVERGPELDHHKLTVALTVYTRRVMYLRSLVAGAARVDLEGNPAGEVTVQDAEHAAARLAKILASREAAAKSRLGHENEEAQHAIFQTRRICARWSNRLNVCVSSTGSF